VAMVVPVDGVGQREHNVADAQALFEDTCTMCHELDEVEEYPLQSQQDISDLLQRMVGNGLEVTEEDSETIAWYINRTYVD